MIRRLATEALLAIGVAGLCTALAAGFVYSKVHR